MQTFETLARFHSPYLISERNLYRPLNHSYLYVYHSERTSRDLFAYVDIKRHHEVDKQVQGFKTWSGLRFPSHLSLSAKEFSVSLSYYLASFISVSPGHSRRGPPLIYDLLVVFLEDKRSGCTGKTMPWCRRFIATMVSRCVGIVSLEDYIGSPRAWIISICVFHLESRIPETLPVHRVETKPNPV